MLACKTVIKSEITDTIARSIFVGKAITIISNNNIKLLYITSLCTLACYTHWLFLTRQVFVLQYLKFNC